MHGLDFLPISPENQVTTLICRLVYTRPAILQVSLGFSGPTDTSTSLLSNMVGQTTVRETPGLRVMKPGLLQKALYQGVYMDVGRRKRSNQTDWDLERGSLGLTGL